MIDELDKKLIQELQQDGRVAWVDLAQRLGVTEATIRKRFKRLTLNNILKVVAVPNLRELGYHFITIMGFQVRMEQLREVARQLLGNQYVCYATFVTGRYDIMAIVVTRSSEEFSKFIESEISAIPGITRTETFVRLDMIKGEPGLTDTTQLIQNMELS